MQFRPIGRSGVSLSRVGLGGYELGPEPDEEPDVDRAARVIETAIDSGVNWLDTSENYLETRNETVIGAGLGRMGGEFLVASKVAPGEGVTGGGSGFRRDQILRACQASLKRLRRQHIDVYFLHWPDDTGVPLEETWGAMAELADAGLVRAIGMSNYSVEDVERCHAQRPVDVVQVGLNLIDYLDERAAIARYGELGIPVTIFEPLASGILGGRTLEEVLATWTGPWVEAPFFKRLLSPGRAERSFSVADGLRPIADRLGATVAQVAISWILHQPGVTAAIAGSRNGGHMRENAEAVHVDLTGSLDEIEALIPLGPTFVPKAEEVGPPGHELL
jgi:aryl-alcohol dehydrogenase-like predicted oxidoreductase